MAFTKQFIQRLALALTLASGAAAVPMLTQAQGLPGLTIFSGVERENQLGFRLDRNGIPAQRDRYHLRIPSDKMNLAVNQFTISYPDYYGGSFDPDEIEVRVAGESVALDEVVWDEENQVIEIYPLEPVPAGTRVVLVLSNVRNPRTGGTYYFNALVRSPGDVPLSRYVGTWIITIGRE